jgi:excisionase family DNA binding protein
MLTDSPGQANGGAPRQMPGQPTWSTKQVCRQFGVTAATVYRWSRIGRLPFERTPGGQRRYLQRDVEALNGAPLPAPAANVVVAVAVEEILAELTRTVQVAILDARTAVAHLLNHGEQDGAEGGEQGDALFDVGPGAGGGP